MNRHIRSASCVVIGFVALLGGPELISADSWTIVKEANAVIGRPLTPMSYAGVARRTTRRAVIATTPVTVAPAGPTCVQVVDAYGRVSYRCP